MKFAFVFSMLMCAGCHGSRPYQRFVLVPNPTGINNAIPAGALALDTKIGQLCYTVGGGFTSGEPAIDMCSVLLKSSPD